jgi:hypothetical protein
MRGEVATGCVGTREEKKSEKKKEGRLSTRDWRGMYGERKGRERERYEGERGGRKGTYARW